jgi:hypothetical protein
MSGVAAVLHGTADRVTDLLRLLEQARRWAAVLEAQTARVAVLHREGGHGMCIECGRAHPCPTAEAVGW